MLYIVIHYKTIHAVLYYNNCLILKTRDQLNKMCGLNIHAMCLQYQAPMILIQYLNININYNGTLLQLISVEWDMAGYLLRPHSLHYFSVHFVV